MNESTPCYITTAIPYVNARPHVGFALEAVITDALARHRRRRGRDVWLGSGTDENSLKNVLAAERAGLPVAALVDRHAAAFAELAPRLSLSYDSFLRTGTDPRHANAVHCIWRACAARGDLYRRTYRGRYCVGCEQFYEPSELSAAGRCPDHGTEPETIEEENWFFRLSRYEAFLRDAIESGRLDVQPESARNESLSFIGSGLRDLSVSRSAKRARGWGIEVPGDRSQVVYVWLDALTSYLSALGYGSTEGEPFRRLWSNGAERVHVIGKGITRFHAVYWPAFLASAGLELPTRILVHGYLTVGGEKISKSAAGGDTIEPGPLAERFGADAFRYYLLRHVSTTKDGDFSLERLEAAHDAELANQLGNLVSRSLGLVEQASKGVTPEPRALEEPDRELVALASSLGDRVDRAVDRFALDDALDAIFALVSAANRYVDRTEPWRLARSSAPADRARLDTVLYHLVEAVRIAGDSLAPFLPAASAEILSRTGGPPAGPRTDRWGLTAAGTRVRRGDPLFVRRGRKPYKSGA